MDTEYTEKTYGVDRFLLEGWFSIEEIEKLLVEMKGRVITPPLPAQRTWVGLTDEEILRADPRFGKSESDVNPYQILGIARDLEAKLKERNT